jgi:1-aminocyclopropane-1-carboxylate deaminase/D-cysteine desulfhydrase-like pyridoxal-dependent ACC family enzyme
VAARSLALAYSHLCSGLTRRPCEHAGVLDRIPRVDLATLPTPLERGPELPGGARLWIKRDDLTGLGAGGNKVRKLEFLGAEALAAGARTLVTVGAAQSDHCRVTAAAGTRLGLDVHLVLSGDRPQRLEGNLALAALFGAQLHFVGCPDSHWGELEIAGEQLTAELTGDGLAPYSIPIGGSTPKGAVAYAAAYVELLDQCDVAGISPRSIVFASSSGGTHAGLVAGRALVRADGRADAPAVLAIGVAKGVAAGTPDIAAFAGDVLAVLGESRIAVVDGDVDIDTRWLGDDYAVPTRAGDEAIVWAARHGGWVLDRTHTGKGFSGLLGNATSGRWGPGDDVVFIHTGGTPAVFGCNGLPAFGSPA